MLRIFSNFTCPQHWFYIDMKSNENNILSKEEKDEKFFSFEGRFNRLDYFELTVGVNSIFSYILMKDYFCLSVFAYFFVFYCMIISIQKRCRDLEISGSLLILLFSICFPIFTLIRLLKINDIRVNDFSQLSVLIMMGIHLFFLFMPGKPYSVKDISSPLLKNKYIFFICNYLFFIVLLIFYIK